MIIDSSNLIFTSLNSLILRLTDRLYVNFLRIANILNIRPPFGPNKHSFAKIITGSVQLNKDVVFGSRPDIYSSFRRSPASDAQSVVGHFAGPHEICIERDARAAFTLTRYLSPRNQSSGFESRKKQFSLVTDASRFTAAFALSKGLDAWRRVKSVFCSETLIKLYHNTLSLFNGKILSFLLSVFSSQPYLTGAFISGIRVGRSSERRIGDNHFPEDSRKSSGHRSSGLSFDSGAFDKTVVAFAKSGIESCHLEGSFTQSPSESGRTCLGDLPRIFLPVGYMSSFCQSAPAADGIGIFEPMEIADFRQNNKTEHLADPFGSCDDFESVFEVFICLDGHSYFSEYNIALTLNGLNPFTVMPEYLCFDGFEFISIGSHPSMERISVYHFWSSCVDLKDLPSHDGFDLGSFFCDAMPLPCEHSQMPDFAGRNIGGWNEFGFHDLCDFGGGDFVCVSHAWPQFAEIEGVEQMDFVCQRFEHVPEPVIGTHGFNADADRFFERLDKVEDFSSAMVWNSHFLKGVRFGIQNGISSRCGV